MFTKKVLWIVVIVVLVAAIGAVAYESAAAYQRPLAAPLALDVLAAPTATTGSSETTCGRSGVMTILYLASDDYASWPFGVDVIRFVQIDFDQQTVNLVAVPRDLWVSTPHLADLGISNSRLGLIFYRAGTVSAGTNAVAQALYDNFEVTPDNYVYVEMKYFQEAVDALGGVDVNIPQAVSDGEIHFAAGQQHLSGAQALNYARMLSGNEIDGGWDRFKRQDLILNAVWNELVKPANLLKIPALVTQFKDDVVTDLSPELIADLSCLVDKMGKKDTQAGFTSSEITSDMIKGPGPDSSMIPDVEKIKTFLQAQLGH